MYDVNTRRSRGFGFISFETEDAVDSVLRTNLHELNGKPVEVKRALPKDSSSCGGGYQCYDTYVGNASMYNGNMHMQPQTTVSCFPHYSCYTAPGYGYGAVNNGFRYDDYGSAYNGFGGQPWAYANSNVPTSGYGIGAPGYGVPAPVGQFLNGTTGYGNQGYGYGVYGVTAANSNVVGEQQGSNGVYMGSSSNDTNAPVHSSAAL